MDPYATIMLVSLVLLVLTLALYWWSRSGE
jgi:hypothetical protein